MLAVGLAGTVTAYLGYWAVRRADASPPAAEVECGAGIRQGEGRVPLVLALLYASLAMVMVGYVVWAWLTRPNY